MSQLCQSLAGIRSIQGCNSAFIHNCTLCMVCGTLHTLNTKMSIFFPNTPFTVLSFSRPPSPYHRSSHQIILSQFLSPLHTTLSRPDTPPSIASQLALLVCVLSCNPATAPSLRPLAPPLAALLHAELDSSGFDDSKAIVALSPDGHPPTDRRKRKGTDASRKKSVLNPSAAVAAAVALSNTCTGEDCDGLVGAPDTTKMVFR